MIVAKSQVNFLCRPSLQTHTIKSDTHTHTQTHTVRETKTG